MLLWCPTLLFATFGAAPRHSAELRAGYDNESIRLSLGLKPYWWVWFHKWLVSYGLLVGWFVGWLVGWFGAKTSAGRLPSCNTSLSWSTIVQLASAKGGLLENSAWRHLETKIQLYPPTNQRVQKLSKLLVEPCVFLWEPHLPFLKKAKTSIPSKGHRPRRRTTRS